MYNTLNLIQTKKKLYESKITYDECTKAIQDLPNNKTPGTDGIPIEFYKCFWKYIHNFLLQSYEYSFDNNLLSIEQRRAILSLIPKAGKDIRHLKNWRPIALLNTDYKILAKILANRLQKVIAKLIFPEQVE